MRKVHETEKDFEEKREFDPRLWKIQKKVLGMRRYAIHVLLLLLAAGAHYFLKTQALGPFPWQIAVPAFLVLVLLSLRVALEWERVPILRLGKYRRTAGPGLFFVLPFLDTTVDYLDCRIRVTDFSAERVLTRDAVPVYVDAIIFWMVWDAKKATLEVEHYEHAVSLGAKTALRDIIGKNTLARLLTDRDGIGKQLQKILDSKTNPWGITSLSVEIKDIAIPRALEEAMSREAQAEREKNARLILGEAEEAVSQSYLAASRNYDGDNTAVQLRSLNILMEALKQNGSMILMPSDVPSMMNAATAAGIAKKAGRKTARKKSG